MSDEQAIQEPGVDPAGTAREIEGRLRAAAREAVSRAARLEQKLELANEKVAAMAGLLDRLLARRAEETAEWVI